MSHERARSIKRSQKESQLYQEISQLFLRIALDDKRLAGVSINRVKISEDGGICTVFFYTPGGQDAFEKVLETLILYKPSLRKALSALIDGRYTPQLLFRFDDQFERSTHRNDYRLRSH